MPDQSGKTAIVTGANTGIGYETALALYEKGAHVVLACRSQQAADEAVAGLSAHKTNGTLETLLLDLSDLAKIKAAAQAFLQQHQRLDILINNAGVMIPPASKTADGYELQFGVNFLGHFAFTGHLYPLLNATKSSRIVTVSSNAYLRGAIDFANLHSENSYDPMREYAQSKLANILFSLELQRRIEKTGGQTISIAAQPGANNTELSRHMPSAEFEAAVQRVGGLMDPWQGALPSLYAATSPGAHPGKFYGPDQDGGYRGYPAEATVTANGMDEAVATKLWTWAEKESGLSYPGKE